MPDLLLRLGAVIRKLQNPKPKYILLRYRKANKLTLKTLLNIRTCAIIQRRRNVRRGSCRGVHRGDHRGSQHEVLRGLLVEVLRLVLRGHLEKFKLLIISLYFNRI